MTNVVLKATLELLRQLDVDEKRIRQAKRHGGIKLLFALYAVASLPWWSRLFFWIARRHRRWALIAFDTWTTGSARSVTRADQKFVEQLHIGEWEAFQWAFSLFDVLRFSGAVGKDADAQSLAHEG